MKHSLLQTVSALAFTALVATAMPAIAADYNTNSAINPITNGVVQITGTNGMVVNSVAALETTSYFKSASPDQQTALRNFVNAAMTSSSAPNVYTSGGIDLQVARPGTGAAAIYDQAVVDAKGVGYQPTAYESAYAPGDTQAQTAQKMLAAMKKDPINAGIAASLTPSQQAMFDQKLAAFAQNESSNAFYRRNLNADGTAKPGPAVPTQAFLEDAVNKLTGVPGSQEMLNYYQNQLDTLYPKNQSAHNVNAMQLARDAEWKAAANAALASLTAAAEARVIDQANYDNLINKALEEIYAARLYYESDEHKTLPIPSPLPTPLANALLGQMQSQKAYAAAHPEVCITTPTSAGNPYACGIVDKRLTIDTPQSSSTKIDEPYLGKKVEIVTAVIPPEGKVNTFSQVTGGAVYTIDSNGVVKDSTGKIVGAVDKAGNTYDKDLKLVSDPNGNFISMLNVGKVTTATVPAVQFTKSTTNPAGVSLASTGGGSGSGGGNASSDAYPAVRQQNTYSAKDDNGEIVY